MNKSLKPISSSFIFNNYDKTLDLKMRMTKLINEGEIVTNEKISLQLNEISRKYYFNSKFTILENLNKGLIVPLYSEKSIRLPNTIPAFLAVTNGKVKCFVNLSNHATKEKNGDLNIDTRVLFTLLQAGEILIKNFQKYTSLLSDPNLCKVGSECYSKLFVKVLNKMFSLNMSPDIQNVIIFYSSLFFLKNVMGRDSETYEKTNMNFSLEHCKLNTRSVVESYWNKLRDEDYKDFDTFIKALAKNVPLLESLTTRSFLDNFITSYGPASILMLDYLPFFYYNLFSVVVGSFINNQFLIENTLGNSIDKLYKLFFDR